MASVSTHVLDTARGRPAAGVPVELRDASDRIVADAVTDADGRIPVLADDLASGTYRLRFDVAAHQPDGFYPEVSVTFVVGDERHYHVPLLLSPFGYSTYRGS